MPCESQLPLLLTTKRRTAADISFVRMRIFYAMPSRDPDAFRIIVGFPYHRERFVFVESSPLIPRRCLKSFVSLVLQEAPCRCCYI
jgi:hypothetical protein